jgi:biotin operon repressor
LPSRKERALKAARLLADGHPRQKVAKKLAVSRVTLWRDIRLLRYQHEGQPIHVIRDMTT